LAVREGPRGTQEANGRVLTLLGGAFTMGRCERTRDRKPKGGGVVPQRSSGSVQQRSMRRAPADLGDRATLRKGTTHRTLFVWLQEGRMMDDRRYSPDQLPHRVRGLATVLGRCIMARESGHGSKRESTTCAFSRR
jgi:hypothetical protein